MAEGTDIDDVGTAERVVVVEDDGDLRRLLRDTLADHPVLEVVAEAHDGESAIAACTQHRPGIVVLDLGLPDIAGQELFGRLRELVPWLRIVVYTGTAVTASTTARWGAAGLVRKDQSIRRLVRLLERIADEPLVATLDLPESTRSIAVARRFVGATLSDWRCEVLVADTQLVVSELVTNAVRHAESRCELALSLSREVLRVEVTDHGAGSPEPQPVDPQRPGGRGLRIVSALSSAWGIDPTDDGKLVWAELATA